jgi:transcriptional regulator of acetoin/glycerol metabolism
MVSLSAGVLPRTAAPGEDRRFGGESTASQLHAAVLATWLRSRDLRLGTGTTEAKYVGKPDVDTPLTRSAEQVLRRLGQQLDGRPVSIVLTDPTGVVLSRLTSDADFEKELGQERYADNVEDLACAGVPIRHPISGRTIGAVELTSWRKDAGALLPALASTTAEQIREGLLADSSLDELELFQAYRGTCRRIRGIVFALTSDAVILNDYARTALDPADQVALLAETADALTAGRGGSTVVDLPSGAAARLSSRVVCNRGSIVGVVAHVELNDAESQQLSGREAASTPLPGLVGSAPLWLRACHEVEEVVRSGEWLALTGEPGVGKMALLRTVLLHDQPGRQIVLLDAADAAGDRQWLSSVRETLIETRDSVVVRHVQVLNGPQLRALSSALQHANSTERDPPPWVAVTLTHELDNPYLAPVLRLFPSTVEVPPLRLHLEDVQELVAAFLAKLDHGGQLTCSREAMRILMRASWPGNIEQVHQMLGLVVQHRRAGVIQPNDLPPEALTISRRLLTPLESLTRDAIVASLAAAHGNKVEAARSLGISRATIYRKIHEYGIVPATR